MTTISTPIASAAENRSSPLSPLLIVVVIVLVPIAYVLSAGPALWLCVNSHLPSRWWNVAYWPLTFARDAVPGFHELFQRYLDWWT
jgi:hypothetical protein